MTRGRAAAVATTLAIGLVTTPARAQSWHLRFDANAQRVGFRSVIPDSVRESTVVAGPEGGLVTADGYAAYCFGDGFCRYYRAGVLLHGVPASATTTLAMWGLGMPGLSVHVQARGLTDLTGDRVWPGTSPALRLVEGYAELVRGALTARAGRMLEQSRLGSAGTGGLDGLRASWRFDHWGLEAGGYAGWGLARGTVLPVTSPAVNPLAEFQPGHRQIVAGVFTTITTARLDALAEYRREVDPFTDYFVSERAALGLLGRPAPRVRLTAGADYDIAQGRWGSADAGLAWSHPRVQVELGANHYRPFFDLWTVWGAFSPVPYNRVSGSLTGTIRKTMQLRVRGEWYRYEDAAVSTPLVSVEDAGWRWALDGRWTPRPDLTLEAGGHREYGPGAASRGLDGGVTWRPREEVDLSLRGGSLARPLEFRFQDAGVSWLGAAADWRRGERWRVGVSLDRYWESRDRPDAAAFDWNQWRVSARISLTLRSEADRWLLPPARPTREAP